MNNANKTFGQRFLEDLNAAKNEKANIFKLLSSTLETINLTPADEVKKATDIESVAALKAAKAGYNAHHGACMFGDDYIYLSAKAYKDAGYGDITDFKQDFDNFVNKREHANTNTNIPMKFPSEALEQYFKSHPFPEFRTKQNLQK